MLLKADVVADRCSCLEPVNIIADHVFVEQISMRVPKAFDRPVPINPLTRNAHNPRGNVRAQDLISEARMPTLDILQKNAGGMRFLPRRRGR